jgi:RNA polymerase sigma-70 factor (ECF subfamily)
MRLTGELRGEFERSGAGELPNLSAEDLFAGVSTRLYESLFEVPIRDIRHFYQIASLQIRRELIELCRKGESGGSDELRQMADFYECVDTLPRRQREVFELIWYHEMSREEVAELLGADVAEIKRLWRWARLSLHDRLDD